MAMMIRKSFLAGRGAKRRRIDAGWIGGGGGAGEEGHRQVVMSTFIKLASASAVSTRR